METVFISRISKMGERYIITIPLAIHPQIERLHGKKVLVKVQEVNVTQNDLNVDEF